MRTRETTAKDLARDLALDAGYLSRILRGFRARGLVEKRPAEDDRRKSILSLSSEGKREFAVLDELSRVEIAKLLAAGGASRSDRPTPRRPARWWVSSRPPSGRRGARPVG